MGFFQHMKKGPFGVHQGAQADRACIARNYYEENMNLFLPRVNETRGQSGIVGCELPLVNYITAVSYKAFGFNDRYYRVIMWIIIAFGLYSVFAIFTLFGFNKILGLLLSFGWYYSPILLFYTPNYLPDTASLSFNLMALYQFFLYLKKDKTKKRIILFSVFIGLAALIKVTSLILPIAVIIILALGKYLRKYEPINLTNPKKLGLGIIVSIGVAFTWYKYSAYLNVKHDTSLFFLEGKWAHSIGEFKTYWHAFTSNWLGLIYEKWALSTILIIYIILLIRSYKRNIYLALLSLLYILGTISFFLLMAEQFKYHDYYLITLYPCILLALLYIAVTIKNYERTFLLKNIAVIAAIFFFFNNYALGKDHLKSRYKKGDYWEQSFFYEEDFKEVEKIKKKFNITREEKTFVAYDLNPNVVLYFANLKGYRIAPDFSQEHLTNMFSIEKPRILIINDSNYLNHHPKNLNIGFKKIAKTPTMTFYELDYSKFNEGTNK